MRHFVGWCLAVLALGLSGCGSVERRSESTLPEPPPWNSIEMMMMDTEIVRVDSPAGRPYPVSSLPRLA